MDILIDTIKDTILMLPILLLTYIIIECYERKASHQQDIFTKLQKYGPMLGTLLGLIPQCGFSVIASMLFLENKITLGTLLSVFIATSDEALPVLLANPSMFSSLLAVIAFKIIIAILVGYVIDIFYHPKTVTIETNNDTCNHSSIWFSALLRTIKIFAFIFIISLLLNGIVTMIGEEVLATILLNNTIYQPIIAAIFGFIPNCVASVLLSQLYISGTVSFASLLAGLITNAGVGLLVLYRYQTHRNLLSKICAILFVSAITIGILLQIIM